MILSQGYWMELECSEQGCSERALVTTDGKQGAIREARKLGWSLSQSSLTCYCPECKEKHKYTNRSRMKREIE